MQIYEDINKKGPAKRKNSGNISCTLRLSLLIIKTRRETSSEYSWLTTDSRYGEVVTSTNTILEKNPKFLSRLPQGFTATATTQVAGKQ